MTEIDYCNATDLAKIRSAISILSYCLPVDGENIRILRQTMQELRKLEENLAQAVKIEIT
jgi:hypothetical protein